MLQGFSDIHLKANDRLRSIAYPGPRPLPPEVLCEAEALLTACESVPLDDFTIEIAGTTWRGRRDKQVVDGVWYRLRRMPALAPTLDSLPSPLLRAHRDMLLSPSLLAGGLIYVCGAAGSGKTTTASATVVSRLHQFGGVAYTIEDPPEMPLNGWHGAGYCTQTCVAGDSASDWAESFRCALRSQPAATHQVLFVGEIRDADSARAMLRAASNGFLVIATGFGTDIVSAIDSLARLTSGAVSGLASMLRLVLHQRLSGGRVVSASLASASGSSPVAARIRGGHFAHLSSDVEYQDILASRGINALAG